MRLTRRQLRKIINETIFVDPKGRAVDLTSDRLSPADRAIQEKYKVLNHPNEEIANKARELDRIAAGIFTLDDEGEPVKPTPDEIEEAQEELDFLIGMSHHPNEKIRNAFNSENIRDVNQAISMGEVEMFAPPEYTPPPMTDDEQYEQGIYDAFDTPGGYGAHNYPGLYDSAEANRDYSHEFDVIRKRMKAYVEKRRQDDPDLDYYDMHGIARSTPGWRQIMDKLEDSDSMWEQEFEAMPGGVLSDLGIKPKEYYRGSF